nr:hypothetical protein Itr_chr14CG19230 [Ipomoea trifida]
MEAYVVAIVFLFDLIVVLLVISTPLPYHGGFARPKRHGNFIAAVGILKRIRKKARRRSPIDEIDVGGIIEAVLAGVLLAKTTNNDTHLAAHLPSTVSHYIPPQQPSNHTKSPRPSYKFLSPAKEADRGANKLYML